MQFFQHTSLDLSKKQIRLIKLLPFQPDQVVRCRLETYDWDDRPEYEAVSYVWGDGAHLCAIEINGLWFMIYESLFRFLHHVSSQEMYLLNNQYQPVQPAYIWIDQLCINQSSDIEKNHQVRLMSEIYSGAQGVLCWLGDDESDVTKESTMTALNACVEDVRKAARIGEWKTPGWTITQITADALNKLFDLPYWSRIWIVQEFILAKEIFLCYGNFALSDSGLRLTQFIIKGADISNHLDISIQAQGLFLYRDYRARASSWGGFQMIYAVGTFSRSSCSDPRDRIYGLQGIIAETDRCEIDYGKSPQRVFWDAVEKISTHDRTDLPTEHIRNLMADLAVDMGVTDQEWIKKMPTKWRGSQHLGH